MEGSTKFNPKTRKYIKNSEYKIINKKLTWRQIYKKIYRFNKAETEIKKPISTINQEKKSKSKTNTESSTSSTSLSSICPKLKSMLSKEFGEFDWTTDTKSDTSVKLDNNDKSCLVNPNHQHSSINHSCIFLNKKGASFANCLSHGKRQIPNSANLYQIKQILGLIETKQEDLNDFEELCKRILQDGENRQLKKANGYVYEPKSKSPIVYQQLMEYPDYLNELFSDKSDKTYNIFRRNVANMDKLLKYMDMYNDEEFAFLKTNKYIFSFLNGYLDISDLFNLKFVSYNNLKISDNIATTIHFDIEFNSEWIQGNCLETPIFDQIVNNHLAEFEEENDNLLYDTLCGMFGRLHYDIHKYDSFNCMLYLHGYANTGKSTVSEFVLSNHQKIGIIAANEPKFPLMTCYQSELAFNGDVKRDFHKDFDKTQLQKCIEGARMDIAIKNKPSINDYKWTAPLFFVGNYFLDYRDESNAIPRRLCIFSFNNFIENRDASLQKKMFNTERHLFLIKSLLKYRDLIQRYKNKTFQDWDIKYLLDNTLKVQSKSDYVFDFCNLAPKDFKYWPIYEEGCEMPVSEFKKYIERYVYLTKSQKYRYTHNKNALKALGYDTKTIKLCGNCGNKPNGGKCCSKFNRKNRRNKTYIMNMKIQRISNCDINSESDNE